MATRSQDRERRARMRANGPVGSFGIAEIGARDKWVCGICRDPSRPVEQGKQQPGPVPGMLPPGPAAQDRDPAGGRQVKPRRRRPLSASIDHIVPVAAGGTHTRANVQIAHLFCNQHKNAGSGDKGFSRPEYARAVLDQLLDGTPVPEDVHRGCFPSWTYPASRRAEFMIALYIAAGNVAADPRYGDPEARSDRFSREIGEDRFNSEVAKIRERRRRRKERWQH
jgi:hypothetical protein